MVSGKSDGPGVPAVDYAHVIRYIAYRRRVKVGGRGTRSNGNPGSLVELTLVFTPIG